MSLFRSIEKKLEGLVEGGFGRAFKASVQPVELAHKLAKEMGDHKTVGVSNVYVPNEFDVYLGPDDFEHLSSFEDSLKVELSNYVTAFARREGWTLVAPPRITLHQDDDLRVGEFGIATATVSAPAGGFEEPAGMPAMAAMPAAPPSAAPGPIPDQTVLYQEAPAPAAAARATGPSPRRSPSSGAAAAATSSSPTPTSHGSTPRSVARTTASCCAISAPPTARASIGATCSRPCCSTATASSSGPPSCCSRGSPDPAARVNVTPAPAGRARRGRSR